MPGCPTTRASLNAETKPPRPLLRCPLVPEATLLADQPVSASSEKAAREIRTEPEKSPAPNDPLANIREREDRRPGFQYNPEPDVKKLI